MLVIFKLSYRAQKCLTCIHVSPKLASQITFTAIWTITASWKWLHGNSMGSLNMNKWSDCDFNGSIFVIYSIGFGLNSKSLVNLGSRYKKKTIFLIRIFKNQKVMNLKLIYHKKIVCEIVSITPNKRNKAS